MSREEINQKIQQIYMEVAFKTHQGSGLSLTEVNLLKEVISSLKALTDMQIEYDTDGAFLGAAYSAKQYLNLNLLEGGYSEVANAIKKASSNAVTNFASAMVDKISLENILAADTVQNLYHDDASSYGSDDVFSVIEKLLGQKVAKADIDAAGIKDSGFAQIVQEEGIKLVAKVVEPNNIIDILRATEDYLIKVLGNGYAKLIAKYLLSDGVMTDENTAEITAVLEKNDAIKAAMEGEALIAADPFDQFSASSSVDEILTKVDNSDENPVDELVESSFTEQNTGNSNDVVETMGVVDGSTFNV
jgi:hypothetical protein